MDKEIDFVRDLDKILDQRLNGYSLENIPEDSGSLKYIRLFTYIRKANFCHKSFKIYESKEFLKKKKKYRNSLNKLYLRAMLGYSWEKFLSRQYTDLSYKDNLFNNWSILHFHLGDDQEGSKLVTRTGDLAIAYIDFQEDSLYFLRIQDHKSKPWYDDSLFQVIYDNWPEVLKRQVYDGEFSIDDAYYTKNKVEKAQKQGQLMCYRIKDKAGKYRYIFPPAMGHTSSGDPNIDVMNYDYLCNTLDDLSKKVEKEKMAPRINPLVHARLVYNEMVPGYCIYKTYTDGRIKRFYIDFDRNRIQEFENGINKIDLNILGGLGGFSSLYL